MYCWKGKALRAFVFKAIRKLFAELNLKMKHAVF